MQGFQNQIAQAQALRDPNASLGVPAQNYGQEIPGQQRGSPMAPAPTGMQTLNTPLDPNGGMQVGLPPTGLPPQQGGQPPWARQGMGGWGQGGRFGQGGMGHGGGWQSRGQFPGQGQGWQNRGAFPGQMNPQMQGGAPQPPLMGMDGAMFQAMQGTPGQAATLQPQGTVPKPAGAALPVTNQLAAPNLYGR